MKKTLLLISFLLLTLTTPTTAQDGSQCDTDQMTDILDTTLLILQEAQNALAENNLPAVWNALDAANQLIWDTRSICSGWHWEGTTPNVLGPLNLEFGVYIVDYYAQALDPIPTLGNSIIIDFENLDDDEYISGIFDMGSDDGQIHEGRETIRLDGGRYLIDIGATSLETWQITLIKP